MTAAATGLPVSIQRMEKLIQLLMGIPSGTTLYGVSRGEREGDTIPWCPRMGAGAPKSGGLRKAHGAPQAGEGQELERFVRRAPAVLVGLARKARPAPPPG